MDEDTILVINGVDFPPWSARGLTQTLTPIDAAGSMRRTVNGDLLDLSVPELRKYGTEITCRDLRVPAIDNVWPGQQVVVDCVCELSLRSDETETETDVTDAEALAGRTIVPGSPRLEGRFLFYRPRLTMRVASFSTDKDEYGAEVGWTLRLEEV